MLGCRSGQASRLLRALQTPSLAQADSSQLLTALLRTTAHFHQCYHGAAATDNAAALDRWWQRQQPADGGGSGSLQFVPAACRHQHCSRGVGVGITGAVQSSSKCSSRRLSSSAAAERLDDPPGVAVGSVPDQQAASLEGLEGDEGLSELEEEAALEAAEADAVEGADDAPPLLTVDEMLAVGGPKAQEAAATLQYLTSRVGLSEEEAKGVLHRIVNYAHPRAHCARLSSPRFISCEHDVKPVVEFLMSMPGMNIKRCLTRSPHILVDSPRTRMESNKQRFLERLEMQSADLARVVAQYPFVLQEDLSKRIFPILDFLGSLGMPVAQQRGIFLRYPKCFCYSTSKIQEGVTWLRKVGLTEANLRSVLWKFFVVVTWSENRVNHWLGWLREQQVPEEKFAHVIARLPMVLTYGQAKRDRFLEVMREELGLPQETVARVLVHVPDTLGRSPARLRRNVEVMKAALGFTDEEIRRLVHANPGVLRFNLSSSTYDAKLRFLKEGFGVSDVKATLLTHPFYLCYRLDRIAARGLYLKASGQAWTSITAWLAAAEAIFCERFARTSLADYHSWLASWRNTEEGQYWLGEAAQRRTKMSEARIALEQRADAAAADQTEAALQQEAAASAEQAERLNAAERLLREQLGSAGEGEGLQHAAAQALADATALRAETAEGQAQAALRLVRERQAAAVAAQAGG